MFQAALEFLVGILLILGAFFNAGAEKLNNILTDGRSLIRASTTAVVDRSTNAVHLSDENSIAQVDANLPVRPSVSTSSNKNSTVSGKVTPGTTTPIKITEKPVAKVKTSLPSPIKNINPSAPTGLQSSGLDEVEIIALTNIERIKNNLPPLKPNLNLRAMAEAKAVDMINKQYFEHVSPSGTTIGDLALTYRYKYLHIGENLALGDFASSSHVVDGWMNSPGHRANILGNDYQEIGVAVIRGKWEGREVWWAVQEFGKPYPVCAEPNSLDRKKIEIYEGQLTQMRVSIENLKAEIESFSVEDDVFRQKVKDFNTIIDLYNKLLGEEKDLVTSYNEQIKSYNICMGV